MTTNKREKRVKIIPDSIFHELWMMAEKEPAAMNFIKMVMDNEKIMKKLYKANIDESECFTMLRNIYKCANMTFKEIVDESKKKKVDISHILCTPIRTIEDWYSGKNKCPSVARFSLIKQFFIINLGKYIYLESIYEYKQNKPSVYEHTDDFEINKSLKRRKKESVNRAEDHKERTFAESYRLNPAVSMQKDMAYLDNLVKKRKAEGKL